MNSRRDLRGMSNINFTSMEGVTCDLLIENFKTMNYKSNPRKRPVRNSLEWPIPAAPFGAADRRSVGQSGWYPNEDQLLRTESATERRTLY